MPDEQHDNGTLPEDTGDDPAGVVLDAASIDELRPFGAERAVEHGEYLFRAGDATYDFVVMLEGSAEILRVDDTGETVIAVHGEGRFLGELNLFTGQRVYLSAAHGASRTRARDRT